MATENETTEIVPEINIRELIKTPTKLKNISSYELLTTYMAEALKTESLFTDFLKTLYAHVPWAIKAIIMAAPSSGVYGLKELFRDELAFLPPEPKYKYGSQTLYYFLKEIERAYQNRAILDPEQRKRIMFKSAEVLDNEDYKSFVLIMNNELNPKIYKNIRKLYKENDLPENIYSYFMFSLLPSELVTVPDNLFSNDTNSARMYIPDSDISYYLIFNNIFFSLSDTYEKSTKEDIPLILSTKLFNKAQSYSAKPYIVMVSDNDIIGILNHSGIVIYKEPTIITEHVFSTKVCQGLKLAFVMQENRVSPSISEDRVIGTIGYKQKTLETITKKIDSFSSMVLPYFGYTTSVLDCKEAETEKQFYVFALSEKASKLDPEKTKELKLASLLGRYFLVG
mgnify:CR=1 FL=1